MNVATMQLGFIEVPGHVTLDIYAIGCKHKCPGCHNANLQDFNYPNRQWLSDELMINKLRDSEGLIDGICWVGGDCFFQQERYEQLTNIVKKYNNDLFNCLYTGAEFEDLPECMINHTDLIVDGKWMGKILSHPDTNQRIFTKIGSNWEVINYQKFVEFDGKQKNLLIA